MSTKIDWATKVSALSVAAGLVAPGPTRNGINSIKGKLQSAGVNYDSRWTLAVDDAKASWMTTREQAWNEVDRVCLLPGKLAGNKSLGAAFPKLALPVDYYDRSKLDERVEKFSNALRQFRPSFMDDAYQAFVLGILSSAQSAFDREWERRWGPSQSPPPWPQPWPMQGIQSDDNSINTLMIEADKWIALAEV